MKAGNKNKILIGEKDLCKYKSFKEPINLHSVKMRKSRKLP